MVLPMLMTEFEIVELELPAGEVLQRRYHVALERAERMAGHDKVFSREWRIQDVPEP